MHIHSLQIGGVRLPNNLMLAPMAGVTDRSFRGICHHFGCGLTFSEMVSAKSLVYNNANTIRLLDNDEQVRPWAVQFFGREPDIMEEAVRRLEHRAFDIIDINMGCPVPKIVKNGEGCALMDDPVLAGRIIEAAARASARPVTVKIRKGFSRANAVEMALAAQESGASAVTVHGRTREQYYSGEADWEIIAEVKQALKIPVIGNGDIASPETALRRLGESGVDGLMLARGAMGNPWLFKRTLEYAQTGILPGPPDRETVLETAAAHVNKAVAHKGEKAGVTEMRKHLSWYTRGMPSAARLRKAINTAGSLSEIMMIIENKEPVSCVGNH